jgi:Tol biopolymer transport system component
LLLLRINIDGTERRQVTDLPGGACQPDWSPDGTRIVFISPCDRNQEQYPGSALYIIEVDSNRLSDLPSITGGDFDPKWSPDGSRIVFTSLRNSPLAQLFILSLEDNSIIALSQGNMNDFQPSWSPDGEKIILVSDRFQGEQIWVMNADGQNPRLFSRNQGFSNSHPSWSLDNNTVLFTQTREGGVPRVTFAPNKFVETGNEYAEYRIGQAELAMQEGMYSPDCNWVVFEGWEAVGDRDIYIIAVTDTPPLNLTSDSSYDFDPAWKPAP